MRNLHSFQRTLADDKGVALVELAVTMPLLVLVLFGVVSGGLVLDRYMTTQQLARNAASMFSRGTNFAVPANQDLLLDSARGLDLQKTSGQGVVILTRVELAPPGTANDGQIVIAERHLIGDASFRSSRFGAPDAAIWPHPDKPSPNGDVKDYVDEPSAVATNVPATLSTLPLAESMFIVEVFHNASDLSFGRVWGISPQSMNALVYF